jgi:CMP-N-acetylneuraminic acid synthetase
MRTARRVAAIVPVRSGSKRIADKNLAEVGGRPLLTRAVHTALAAFGTVVVSTDSEHYAAIARAAGAIVPALRPGSLASDDTPTDAVVAHALGWRPDAEIVVVVQATSPFTTATDLRAVVEALDEHPGAGTAFLARSVSREYGYALVEGPDGIRALAPDLYDRRSQDLPALWLPTGGAFAAPAARVRDGGALQQPPFAIVPVPAERALDIDDAADLERARELAR